MQKTVGIHPKVKLPAGVIFAIGVVLIVIGYVVGDDSVVAVGWAAIGSSGLGGFLGFIAPPGLTTTVDTEGVNTPDA